MNYSELVTAIQRHTQNDETTFVAEIPNLIKMVEKRIFNELQLLVARKNVTTATAIGSAYVQAPSDFLAPYSLSLIAGGVHSPLLVVDETLIREAFPDASVTAPPTHYSLFDHNTILLGPTPDSSNYLLELHYFYYPPSIVTAGTSWLGDNADHVLLNGALVESYRFMKSEEDVLARVQQAYDSGLNGLRVLSAGRDRGDAYRYGQFRVPVQA